MTRRIALAIGPVALALALGAACQAAGNRDKGAGTRPAVVAGQFYPADAAKLRGAVEAYLHDALPPRDERPIAIVAPHAGYIFSGQIAADAWRQAAGRDYDLVVILGTNHTTAGFHGVSVYPGSGLETPLGVHSREECDRPLEGY